MTDSKKACGLTVLRVVVGIVFLKHGWMKLFTYGMPGVTGMLTMLHIPLPAVAAIVLTWVELLGGLALILGAGTRVASALLAFDMLVAIFKVHLKNGFFLPTGYEFALTLLAATICLMLAGAGAPSVDKILEKKRPA